MIFRRELFAIALFMRMIAAAFGGASESKVAVDLHAPRAEIRAVLLRYTPVGSKAPDVLKFIATQLELSGSPPAKIDNGPATGPAAEKSQRRGAKTIRVYLGQYFDHPAIIFLSAPIIMRKEVSVQWAFDEHDRLIEIFVDKHGGVY
jgi:hypothetical protein